MSLCLQYCIYVCVRFFLTWCVFVCVYGLSVLATWMKLQCVHFMLCVCKCVFYLYIYSGRFLFLCVCVHKGWCQKSVSFVCYVGMKGVGGLGSDHKFWSKDYHFLFLLPFDPDFCVLHYLGVVKDRLWSWLCVKTLNNFCGINRKNVNFGTH